MTLPACQTPAKTADVCPNACQRPFKIADVGTHAHVPLQARPKLLTHARTCMYVPMQARPLGEPAGVGLDHGSDDGPRERGQYPHSNTKAG